MLSFRHPYPLADGANIRIYNICKILAREHVVDLLSINEGPIPESSMRSIEPLFGQIYSFSFHPLNFKLNTLKGMMSHDPLQTYYYHFRKIQRWIDSHLCNYDLIFCCHIRMTRYLRKENGIPKVIDFIDATSINYSEAQNRAQGIWRLILPIENRRTLAYELKMLNIYKKSFITSGYDKVYLKSHAGSKCDDLIVIPNGVREDLLIRPQLDKEEDWIVFLGKMNYTPNIDAVLYFAAEVFPYVRARLPEIKFIVVGTSPTKEVLELARISGILVTGYVEDPYFYLERAKIVVAPLRFSSGIQNKILEGMALRKSIVTTSKGARGIVAQDGNQLIVADDPKYMAKKIVDLLLNKTQRNEIGFRARQLIEEHYRWDSIGDKMLKELGKILS